MPLFKYEALDASGRSVQGELEADDVSQVAAQLSLQGWQAISIEMASKPERSLPTSSTEPIEPPALTGSSSAGQATDGNYVERLDQALSQPKELLGVLDAITAEPASRGLRSYLSLLTNSLRRGIQAKEFLQNDRLSIWLPIVLGSAQSKQTHLNERYRNWLTQVNDERTRWRSLWSTFTYPIVLLGCVVLIVLPIAIFIVPTFQRMFREFGLRLPPPTMLVFSMADLINHKPLNLILGLAFAAGVALLAIRYWLKHALGTRYIGFLIAGNSMSVVAMSRLTSALAELLESGAPLQEALVLAGVASRHAYFRELAQRLALELSNPELLPKHAPAARAFPETLMYALGAGAGNRPNVPLIRELAQMYSSRVRSRLNRSIGLTSPLFIVAIGFIVGMVVIALFMPLVQMITSLS